MPTLRDTSRDAGGTEMIFFSPPLARASKQEASNGLLDVGAAVDGGRDALGYRLVDVGHGSEATELLLFLRGH